MFRRLAQNIAKSASEIIGCGVLVTDEKGIIIGCDKENRLGDFHEPSVKVMLSNAPMTTSVEDASKLKGVFPGYTLPIQLFDKVVGSISIAGMPQDVERYGLLVQKQAEIMLRGQAYLESSMLRDREMRNFVKNVASYYPRNKNEEMIIMQGKELGCDISWCRLALVIEMTKWQGDSADNAFKLMLSDIKSFFSNPRNVVCPHENYKVTVFFAPSSSGEDEKVMDAAESICQSLCSSLEEKELAVNIAIGFPSRDLSGLGRSLRSAKDTLRLAKQLAGRGIIPARRYAAETLLGFLPYAQRNEFINSVLKGLIDRNDFEEIKETFMTWCESPFASGEVAEKMSMHRNSLQYRLKKIRNLTGRDPWNFKDAFELWISFVLLDMR